MEFVQVTCPRCASPRVDRIDDAHYRCAHCQAMFLRDAPIVVHAAPPATPGGPPGAFPVAAFRPPQGVVQRPTGSLPGGVVVTLAALLVAAIGGIAFVLSIQKKPPPLVVVPNLDSTITQPSLAAAPAPPPESLKVKAFRQGTSLGSPFWLVTLENTGAVAVGTPSARASLFDGSGRRVVEQKGYAAVKHLDARTTTPLVILAMNAPKFAHADIAPVAPEAPSAYDASQVTLTVVDFAPRKDGTMTEIAGTVKNTTPTKVKFVQVIASGLDAKGELVSYADTYATEKELAPGAASGFSISAGTFQVEPPATYRLIAVAMPDS